MKNRKFILPIALSLLLIILSIFHLVIGELSFNFTTFYNSIFNYNASNSTELIIHEFRIPRLLIALIAGSGLAVSGMLMQTLFNNPLAGPYVLGINTGSSLFVACSLMTGIPFFTNDFGIISSALIGAFIFGLIIISFSSFVRSHISLLLIGLMLGSFTSSIISMLQTNSAAEELKSFTMWTMGSLQQVEFKQLPLIVIVFMIGMLLSVFLIKPLNALVLGVKASSMLGLNIKMIRFTCIGVTAVLTGLITAFCGPIAFVGLAVPNITRLLFKTQSHGILLVGNSLIGACFLVGSDLLIELIEPYFHLPINVFTSFIGAPIVIYILIKRLK